MCFWCARCNLNEMPKKHSEGETSGKANGGIRRNCFCVFLVSNNFENPIACFMFACCNRFVINESFSFPISYRLIFNKCSAVRLKLLAWGAQRHVSCSIFKFYYSTIVISSWCFPSANVLCESFPTTQFNESSYFLHQPHSIEETPLTWISIRRREGKSVLVRSWHSRAEKRFGWNVTSAQKKYNEESETYGGNSM